MRWVFSWRFRGKDACFTWPEMKTERVSYDVITPSAARGMVEAVYYHPGPRLIIDRINVLSPIRFANLRRHEVKSKLPASTAMSLANIKGMWIIMNALTSIICCPLPRGRSGL